MRLFTASVVFLLVSNLLFAQKKVVLNDYSNFDYHQGASSILLGFNIDYFNLEKDVEGFTRISHHRFQKTYENGSPDLPVLTRIVCVPAELVPVIEIQSFHSDTFSLAQIGMDQPVIPAISSLSKSADNSKVVRTKSAVYARDEYGAMPVVECIDRGIMRDKRILELVYHPFTYNPIKNKIVVRTDIRAKLAWAGNQLIPATFEKMNRTQDLNAMIKSNAKSKEDVSDTKTFAIVAPLEYKTTLQPFIKWKQQMGFSVVQAYIGEQISTATTANIKSFLQNLYLHPIHNRNPLEYILLVGDVADIPTFSGVDGHPTDLYYGEYTDDYLPECYIGRMSAKTTDELDAILYKTFLVEKGIQPDKQYQNTHILVSGVDATNAPTYGNGALNYFLTYYSNSVQGITPKYYLYGSGSPVTSNNSQAHQKIIQDFNDGAGVVYYTAHCGPSGWSNPSFSNSDLSSLTNTNKFPLVISNCCQSYMFDDNSFGENIVSASNRGAVAYIGASDYSYWDEDYYWGIGVTTDITPNPTYEQSGIGSWDAWFHTHGEAPGIYAFSASQLIFAGNMAVEASSSNLKKYYWEIYGLSGDPSLVPAKFMLQSFHLSDPDPLIFGQTQLDIQSVPDAMVSLYADSIVATAKADASGLAHLEFNPIQKIGSGTVEMVITHPDFYPKMEALDVLIPNRPYLVVEKVSIIDSAGNNNQLAESGEMLKLSVKVKNISNMSASNIKLSIKTNSSFIQEMANDSIFQIDNLPAQDSLIVNFCTVQLKNNIIDQSSINFTGSLNYCDSINLTFNKTITVNAPDIYLSNVTVDELGIGNLNGILDPSEKATLQVEFTNKGHMQVSNTLVYFTVNQPGLLAISDYDNQFGSLEPESSSIFNLPVKVSDSFFAGQQVDITYQIVAGINGQYLYTNRFEVVLGAIPTYPMVNDATNEIITAYFYDSGGADNNYKNNEKLVTTFVPHTSGEGLEIEFIDFDVEASNNGCWDKLEIYDGKDITAQKLTAECNYNFQSTWLSQNADGALTFKFTSDGDLTKSGWKAVIKSSPMHSVTFIVTNQGLVIDSAKIDFINQSQLTNETGEVFFDHILSTGEKKLSVIKEGYYDLNETIGAISSDTIVYLELVQIPDIKFIVSSSDGPVNEAKVVVEGVTKYTNLLGEVVFTDQLPGQKTFHISKLKYVDTTGYVQLNSLDVEKDVQLSKSPTFAVEFKITNDQGALNAVSLSINNEVLTSDATGKIIASNLFPDTYHYSLSCSGHNDKSGSLVVTNQNLTEEIQLTRKKYSAMFNIYDQNQALEGVEISFADTTLISTALGQAYLNKLYSNAEETFTIHKDAYEPYEGIFIPNKDTVFNVQLNLLGIGDQSNAINYLYPNPVNSDNSLTISMPGKVFSISIMDELGHVVFMKSDCKSVYRLTRNLLKDGIYVVNLQVDGSIMNQKLIVY